jgi:ABC-2 type transport system permease protein/lipopolysaccharide transport system permease protein
MTKDGVETLVTLAQQDIAAVPAPARRKRGWSFPGAAAFLDLWQGWREFRELWVATGWYDIRKRYRRSLLGPFWITISLGAFVAGLSLVYGPLLGRDISTYAPYLAFGFIGWSLISELVTDSCNVFISNTQKMHQLRAPVSLYIYEMIWRNLLILAHNLLIYVVMIIFFPVKIGWATLLLVPGILLVAINGVLVSMLLGTLCARFRDIPPIVQTVMRMMFLLTPVLWHPDQMKARGALVDFNPFFYFLELIRDPLLGNAPPPFIWAVALGLTLALASVAIPFYARFHKRIAYWV